eukprot:2817175-Prymnesium_polylepis.1
MLRTILQRAAETAWGSLPQRALYHELAVAHDLLETSTCTLCCVCVCARGVLRGYGVCGVARERGTRWGRANDTCVLHVGVRAARAALGARHIRASRAGVISGARPA